MPPRPFQILGLQQIAVGAPDKKVLAISGSTSSDSRSRVISSGVGSGVVGNASGSADRLYWGVRGPD